MLSNFKLGLRLAIGFGVVLLFLVLVGGFAINTMTTLTDLNSKLYKHPFTVQRATLYINTNIIKIHRAMKDVVLSRSEANLSAVVNLVTELDRHVLEEFLTVEARFLGQKEMYERARELFKEWRPIRAEVIDLVRRGKYDQAAAITKGKGNDHVLSIVASVNALDAFAAAKAAHFYTTSQQISSRTFVLMYSLIAIAIAVCALLTYLIARSISRPAREIAEASKAIARGELDHTFSYHSKDEIGQMADSLRHMISELTAANASLKGEVEKHVIAEKALAASEERYRSVVEDQTEVICRFEADGTLTFVNEVFCRMFDKTAEELVGNIWHPVALEEDLPVIEEKLKLLSIDNPTVLVENRIINGNKEVRWMQFINRAFYDAQGNLTQIQSVGRDIHDQKLVQEKLDQYQEHLEEMVLERAQLLDDVGRIAKIGGWEMDLITRQAKWTKATYRIVGIEPGEAIPGPDEHTSYYLPKYRPMIEQAMEALINDGQPLDFEAELNSVDGSIRWCRAMGRVIRKEGRAVRLVGTLQDITEQKKLETERRHIEETLRQAQKMESIGTLAGGIAHDFNNILTAIMGYGQLDQDDLDPASPIQDYLGSIITSSTRAKNLVRQMLAFSRKQILEMKTFALNEVVTRNHSMISALIGEDITLDVFLNESTGLVKADFNQLEQVLLNLAVNARDAMPQGGELTFETARVGLDAEYAAKHPEVNPGDYAMLAVSDNGPGIEPEVIDHMFDPFFTTKEMGRGTGMGLAMVHGIIKQHQGHIYVYSELDRGTTFKIYLPVQVDGAAEEQPERSAQVARPGGHETILLVEDEPTVRDFINQALSRMGYAVMVAENGLDALELVDRENPDLDLLLTDVIMPKMSGKDLYLSLTKDRPGLKVVYMSGYTHNVIAHQGVLDPGVAFIQKPVSLDNLAVKIRKTLED